MAIYPKSKTDRRVSPTALLSVVSILVGVYGDVNAYLSDYGPETLFLFRFDPGIHTGRLTPDERERKPLTLEDAEAIERSCPAVRAVTATVFPRFVEDGPEPVPVTARYLSKEVAGVDYNGTLPATEEVFNSRPQRGRFHAEPVVDTAPASTGPGQGLEVCPDCASELVYPTDWHEAVLPNPGSMVM